VALAPSRATPIRRPCCRRAEDELAGVLVAMGPTLHLPRSLVLAASLAVVVGSRVPKAARSAGAAALDPADTAWTISGQGNGWSSRCRVDGWVACQCAGRGDSFIGARASGPDGLTGW
jgi:hypothetical protein